MTSKLEINTFHYRQLPLSERRIVDSMQRQALNKAVYELQQLTKLGAYKPDGDTPKLLCNQGM